MTTKDAGFTLIELLVSLAIFLMCAGLMAEGLRYSAHVTDRSERVLKTAQDHMAVRTLLRDQLARVVPVETRSGRRVAFVGESDTLSFWGPVPRPLGGGGLMWGQVLLRDPQVGPSGGKELVFRWCPEPDGVDDETCYEARLLDGVVRMEVRYFDEERQVYLARWQERTLLPQAIEIKLDFDQPAGLSWAPLLVHPRIEETATCEFDPVSKRCRRQLS